VFGPVKVPSLGKPVYSATAVNQQYGRGGSKTPQIQSEHSMVMGFTHISLYLPKEDLRALERVKSI